VREALVKPSVEDIARKLKRTPKSVRTMLQRNRLHVREIRCDLFSVKSLASARRIGKGELHFWIKQGWLDATIASQGRRPSYSITAEALANVYKHHLADLLKRGPRNQSLFEAYLQYLHSPKHTIEEQLLDVRRDKRERAAFAASQSIETPNEEEEDDEDEDEFPPNLNGDTGFEGGVDA
jgi:hypothetical protein